MSYIIRWHGDLGKAAEDVLYQRGDSQLGMLKVSSCALSLLYIVPILLNLVPDSMASAVVRIPQPRLAEVVNDSFASRPSV